LGGFYRLPTRRNSPSQPGWGGEGGLLAELSGKIPATESAEGGLFGQPKSVRRKQLETALTDELREVKRLRGSVRINFVNDLLNADAPAIRKYIVSEIVREGHLANPFHGDKLLPLLREVQNTAAGSFQRKLALQQLTLFYDRSDSLLRQPPSLSAITTELQLYEAISLYGERTGWIQRGKIAPTGQQAPFNFSEFRKFFNQSQTNGELVTQNEVAGWLKRAGLSYRD
jgi:hypothetical protein